MFYPKKKIVNTEEVKEEIKKTEKIPVAPKKEKDKKPATTFVAPKKDPNKIMLNDDKKKYEKKKPESYRDKKARVQKEIESNHQKFEREINLEYEENLNQRKKKCHYCLENIPLDIGGFFKCYECRDTTIIDRSESNIFYSFRRKYTHFHVDLAENSTKCLHCGKKFHTLKEKDREELHLYFDSLGVKDERRKFHLEVCVAEKTAELEKKLADLKNFYGEEVFLKLLAEYYKSTKVNDIIKKELIKFIDVKNDDPQDNYHYCFWNVEIAKMIKTKLNQYDVEFPFLEKCPMCKEKTQHSLEKHRLEEECPHCFSGHFKTDISCGPTGNGTENFQCYHCGGNWSTDF